MNMTGGVATSKYDEYHPSPKGSCISRNMGYSLGGSEFSFIKKENVFYLEENILRKLSLTLSFHTMIFLGYLTSRLSSMGTFQFVSIPSKMLCPEFPGKCGVGTSTAEYIPKYYWKPRNGIKFTKQQE